MQTLAAARDCKERKESPASVARSASLTGYIQDNMIPIPQNLYEQYLTDWLYEKKFQEDTSKSGQSEIELLYRLSKAQMLERDRGEEYQTL